MPEQPAGEPDRTRARAARYVRTLTLLRPAQATARVRLRTQRALLKRFPAAGERLLSIAAPSIKGWPEGYVPFDGRCPGLWPSPDEVGDGVFPLLGRTRPVISSEGKTDWQHDDAPLLWRHHLHYWDWAWALTKHPDTTWAAERFANLYRSWRDATGLGDAVAWSPYVVAVRAWTLCGLFAPLAKDSAVGSVVRADLGVHERFLRFHREADVGGHHLVKNLKALVGLAVATGDETAREKWLGELVTQVGHQVLADGGHAERAPAYHCQVLIDLGDVAGLLQAAGHDVPGEISDAADRMSAWLGRILGPDRSVPLLNDGYPVPPQVVDALRPPVAAGPSDACTLLADSGLAVLRAGAWHVLADTGLPCPDALPSHAHADSLSFLLWHGRTPLLVDSGTSTYAPGPVRAHERSTAAHSTVVVDGQDSTEVWGTFRAGRRARPKLAGVSASGADVTLTASHDGYRHLPGSPVHERSWRVEPETVWITDRVSGSGRHRVEVLLQLAPGIGVTVVDGPDPHVALATSAGEVTVRANGPGRWEQRTATRAIGWDETVPAHAVCFAADADLPVQITTEIRGAVVEERVLPPLRGFPTPVALPAVTVPAIREPEKLTWTGKPPE